MKYKNIFISLVLGVLLILGGFLATSRFQKTDQAPRVSQEKTLTREIASKSSVLGQKEIDKIATQTASTSWEAATVIKVIDGDTIDVLIDGRKETLRLIGINTPETVDPRRPVQCFGEQASSKAKEILSGQSVNLESDESQGETDKYNRLLRYLFLEDGASFNKLMIQEGYAYEYTYQDPYKYQAEFKKAQQEAMEQKKGLWADNACETVSITPVPTSGQNLENYTCDCSKSCTQIKTCEEAYYQLIECKCLARDSDGDGVPCESLCR